MSNIEILKNKVFESVTSDEFNQLVCFIEKDTKKMYFLLHYQDCCESVEIEDICGDLHDLEDTPILLCEEIVNESTEDDNGSFTWTFYKFSTIKGSVTIRWYGESNGYYSESVDLVEEQNFPYSLNYHQYTHLYTLGFFSIKELLEKFRDKEERLGLIETFGVIRHKSNDTNIALKASNALTTLKKAIG